MRKENTSTLKHLTFNDDGRRRTSLIPLRPLPEFWTIHIKFECHIIIDRQKVWYSFYSKPGGAGIRSCSKELIGQLVTWLNLIDWLSFPRNLEFQSSRFLFITNCASLLYSKIPNLALCCKYAGSKHFSLCCCSHYGHQTLYRREIRLQYEVNSKRSRPFRDGIL